MKRSIYYILLILILNNILLAQTPSLSYAKQLGGGAWEQLYSSCVDDDGNIYSTGLFTGTSDFDPGPNNYFLSAAEADVFISKLDSNGNFVWAKQIGGSSWEEGYGISTDDSGNVYSTGGFSGPTDFDPGPGTYNLMSASNYDIYILKLDSQGNFVWAEQLGVANINEGVKTSVSVDNSNKLLLTGYFSGTVDFDPGPETLNMTALVSDDIFILKLNPNGSLMWAKQIGGTSSERANSICVDNFGNVYTTGIFAGITDFDPGNNIYNLSSFGSYDAFVCKFDSLGSFIWAKNFGGSPSPGDYGKSIAVDESGFVYTTGYFRGTADFDPGAGVYNLISTTPCPNQFTQCFDIFISKLDSEGNFVWAKQIGGKSDERANSIDVDDNGNVYTTGFFRDTVDFDPGSGTFKLNEEWDIYVSKFNTSGEFIWAFQLGEVSGSYFEEGKFVHVKSNENIFVSGYFQNTADFDPGPNTFNLTSFGHFDNFITKYYDECSTLNIITQPQSQSVNNCSSATFSVVAGGPPPFTYTWYKNGNLISGATSSTYTTPPLTNSDNGTSYHCTVTNCGGNQITSNNAILTVLGSCIQTYPSISLNNSTLISPQNLIIQGSNFTPYGLVDISIIYEDGNAINTDYPITYNIPGKFQFTLPILQSFKKGKYTIKVKDLSTGNFAPTKIFQVNNAEVPQHLVILSPSPGEVMYVGDLFNITWKDYISSGPPIGQSGLVLKEYKLEISNNNGVTWIHIQNHAESAEINNYKTFTVRYNTYGPGSFKIRITDWDNPQNTATTETFQVSGCTTSDFKPSLEWDASIPTQSAFKNPIGLATDGTARVLVKLKRQTNKPVTSIQATIIPIGDNFNTPQLLGKIMYATNFATYSEEANTANSITTTKTFTTDGNKPEYYFWLVAPDDFTTDINSEAEYRRISINLTISYADNTSEGLTLCKPIYLYRPPVVFVHGILGDPTTFESTYYLNNSGGQSKFDPSIIWKVTKRLDLNAIGPYQTNSDILLERTLDEHHSTENSLINPLIKMHNLGFACKRVDYIAHSMGGAVGRNTINFNDPYYSPGMKYKNYSKGYINKLITICTPHNGSYVADFIIDRLNDGYNILSETIWNYWDLESDLIKYGLPSNAAYDLQAYDGGVILPLTIVKNHLLGADIDQNNALSESTLESAINYGPLKWAYKILTPPSTTIHDYMNNNYNNSEYLQETDMVVSISSQLAGSSPTSAININTNPAGIGTRSIIYGLNKQHVGIAEDLIIGTRLKKLLNAQMSSGFFANEISPNTTGQFTNDNYISRSVLTEDSTQFHFDTNYIVIVNPDTNSVYFVDSTMEISLNIKDTTNLLRLQILFQNELFESYAKDSVQIFITDVHSKYLGTNTIYAIAAYDSLGYTINHIDTAQVVVQSSTVSNDFYVTPNEIYLNPNEVLNPKYHLVFPNFVGHIKPDNDSITYTIADTNVIVYDSIHFNFIAKDTGSTYIVYNYKNYMDTTFVYITERLKNNVFDICSTSDLSLFAGSNDSLKTYRWQVKELNDFSNISNNLNYSGTDSSTLIIINPPSKWYNNQYRCIISDLVGSMESDVYTIRFKNTWNGSVDSLWENPSNWSCIEVPDCNTDVSIPSNLDRYPFINSQAYCRTIKLDSTAFTTVKPGYVLWVGKTNASIVCPGDIIMNLAPGQCGANVSYAIDEAGESCNVILIQNSGLPSGDNFPIGTTTNCFTYVNQNGSPMASCCFDVTVNEYPTPTSTLACNDNVQVSVGADCEAFVSTDMILEGGPYSCYNDYMVAVEGYGSGFGGVTISSSAIGQTLTATVMDPSTGNSCWGTISVEDHILPEVICTDFTIACASNLEPDSTNTPIAFDNCGGVSLTYNDELAPGICPGFSTLLRHWVVTDSSGNTGTCDQVISFLPASLDSMTCPPTYVGSCNSYNSPATTGYPVYNGEQIDNNGLCNLFAFYSDQDTILEGYFTILRTWKIVDTCSSLEIECIQNIISTDNEDPSLTCPDDYETSCIQSNAPEIAGFPTFSDNCSSILSFIDSAISGDPCEGQIFSRTWTVLDNSNNYASCIQYFTLLPVSLDSLVCPSSYIGSCGDNSDPSVTGYPSIDGYPIDANGPCNFLYGYIDQDSITCQGAFISRVWTILDWCTQDTSVCIQDIDLLNNNGQILACPEDILVSIEVGESNVSVDYYVSSACNCGDTIVQTAGLPSGELFPIGTTTNCFILLDSLGTTIDSCCFDVVVYVHCLQGGIIFTTQAEIDSFPINYPGCTTIEGNVTIDDGGSGIITNLNGLSLLTQIEGSLIIQNNSALSNLTGIGSLSVLGSDLYILNNDILTNLTGLDSLYSIPGIVYIQGNNSLTTLMGLESITTIGEAISWGGGLFIDANINLASLSGLSSLDLITGQLSISSNSNLTDLTGLNSLISIGGALEIGGNDNLINLIGLNSLLNFKGSLFINSNQMLTSLEGLSPDSILQSVYITHNTSLVNLDVLENVEYIFGNIDIANNDALSNLNGFNRLLSTYGSILINENDILTDISGLLQLTAIGGSLVVNNNSALTNLYGLNNIDYNTITNLSIQGSDDLSFCNVQSICDYLNIPTNLATISGNATGCASRSEVESYCNGCPLGNLTFTTQAEIDLFNSTYPGCSKITGGITINGSDITNLDGLTHLDSITQYLQIYNNNSLTSLQALDGLRYIGSSLTISNNMELFNLSGLDSVSFIGGPLHIVGNPLLQNLNGLNGLTTISGMEISGNASLINLIGLDSVTSIQGMGITISDNIALTSLAGLNAVTSITGSFGIISNPLLFDLSDFNNLGSIGSGLYISSNSLLSNLGGLGSVNGFNGSLIIENNSSLSSCEAQFICDYLGVSPEIAIIQNNATGCDNVPQVQIACGIPVTCPGILTFNTQADIDSFPSIYVDCSTITGGVTITGPDITNLDSLTQIDSITQGLQIYNNNLLTSLQGLDGLRYIGSGATISNNMELGSLSGLDSVSFIGGPLHIVGNPLLQNLNGLNGLTTISGMEVSGNASLVNLVGLDSVTSIQGMGTTISDNIALTSLAGLNAVTSITGSFGIISNPLLFDLSDLNNLGSIGNGLYISSNSLLSNLGGLGSVNGFSGSLNIENNSSLSSCEAQFICDYLGASPEIAIIQNNSTGCDNVPQVQIACGIPVTCPGILTFNTQADIDSFPSIYIGCSTITGGVTITGPDITNLDSLIQIDSITQGLQIYNNNLLTSLQGLDGLRYIGSGVTISNNMELGSLSGLDSVSFIGGPLHIVGNPLLLNLNGLNGLTTISGMEISGNASLVNLVGLDSVTSIQGMGTTISDNIALTSLAGLNAVTSIGGSLGLNSNPVLANLSALNQVSSVGYLSIINNDALISLSGLGNINYNTITGLTIQNSELLSICDVQSICDYLDIPTNPATISGNAIGCSTRMEVETECGN